MRGPAWGARGTIPTSGVPLKYSNFSIRTSRPDGSGSRARLYVPCASRSRRAGPSLRPAPRPSPPNYTLTDDPPWEGAPLSDAPARAARLAEPRRRAPLRSGGGGRREEPVRERGHPDAPAFAPRPLGAPVLGRRPGRSRHPGPRGRSAAEPVPPDSRQARAGLNLSRASPERGDHRGERAADEIERPWVQRDDGVARGVVGVEGHRTADEVSERAPHRAEHEPPERLGLGRRDHGETVGRDAPRGERPVVAPEEGNAPDDVVADVPPEAEGFERAAHTTEEGRLVAHVPHREAVADAAQLKAQHAGDPRHLGLAHPGARAEIAELLARGEEEAHAE